MSASRVLEPQKSFLTFQNDDTLVASCARDQQSVLRVDVFRVGCRGRLLSASLCKRQLPSIHAPPGSCRLQPLPDDALVLGFRGPQPLRSHFSSTRGSHPKLCQSPMLGLSSPSFSLGCYLESLRWPHTPLLPVGTTPCPRLCLHPSSFSGHRIQGSRLLQLGELVDLDLGPDLSIYYLHTLRCVTLSF